MNTHAAYNEVQATMSLHEDACNRLAELNQARTGALKQVPFPNNGDLESLESSRIKVEDARRVVDAKWQNVVDAVKTYQHISQMVRPDRA